MKLRKNMKLGVSFIFLLLTLTSCLSLINLTKKNNTIDENTPSLSAPEDFYEPNNDRLTPYDLSPFEKTWLSWVSGLGAQWDDDWFSITVSPGEERLVVFLRFFNGDGNIDMEVYNSIGTVVASSTSTTDNEFIDLNVPAGIYTIKIYFGNAGNEYDLIWDDIVPSLLDDYYEVNNFPTMAFNLTYYPYMWLSSINDLGIQKDDDWYQVYLNPGEDWLHVELIYSNTQGNLGIEIYETNGTFLGWSNTIEDNEFLDMPLSSGNFYNIRVYGDGFGNVYDLWWASHVFTGATDDHLEPNNGFYEATWINPPFYDYLKIIHKNEDWFQCYLNYGDKIMVTIDFNSGEGDLDLELFDPDYNQKNYSYYGYDKEFVSFTADVQGEWRIRVNQYTDYPEVYYGLNIMVNIGVHQGDDAYEMNNIPNMAYWLGQDEQTSLSDLHGLAVQGDSDWYAIEVTPGFLNLEVKLNFSRTLGNMYMNIYFLEVYDPNSWDIFPQVLAGFSFNNSEKIDDNVTRYGIYLIEINGNNSETEYDLWWDDHKTRFYDDSFEQNDNQGSAYDISAFEAPIEDRQPRDDYKTDIPSGNGDSSGTGGNGISYTPEFVYLALDLQKEEDFGLTRIDFGVQSDDDFYKLEIEEGFEHLIVFIRYDNAEGRMGLRLYDRHMNLLAENFTNSDNDFIDYVVPSNGTYYLKVFGDDTGNIYNLFWVAMENEVTEMIPGYDILIVLGAIMGISTIVIKKKRSKIRQD
ncbi:hypothetical protein LCGC14_0717980 [marine sediment metagenome]|uniref:Peptidase C-terminal archaeal/bacterial domain-containing protein n=1 Tax=marine sediment metagenome TaxID=412755 RepID=A0A0F9TKM9_9ZZZZ|nr:T9SS type A sorting domain-containing protein [archaeon]